MRNPYLILFLSALILITTGTPAAAFPGSKASSNKFDALFNEQASLSDEELDEMRGGFITSNGLLIDFIFSANTLVDGDLINQVVINSADTASLSNSLQRIIQIGDGNAAFGDAANAADLPKVLSVIQNNLNDLTIQQVNVLDLSVKNFDNYIQQNIVPEIDFQSTLRLVP